LNEVEITEKLYLSTRGDKITHKSEGIFLHCSAKLAPKLFEHQLEAPYIVHSFQLVTGFD